MGLRSQSAMEYLMTYGWAILIIAVVLGAIYSLGLFNGASLAPRAQPGSCEVLRPNGALTTQYVSLAGSCTNELPQYVAQFGGTSYIQIGTSGMPLGASSGTWSAWVYPTAQNKIPFWYGTGLNGEARGLQGGGSSSLLVFGYSNDCSSSLAMPLNTWSMVAGTYNGLYATPYVNGVAGTPCPLSWNTVVGSGYIGADVPFGFTRAWIGYIADVQVYNASLDANSMKALYQEGIGGAPINLQNVVAWLPLNGNANDYSGDIDNGQPYNVIYTNQWLSGYTVP